ncbi:RNA-binding protein [Halobacterium salinarum]|uniref:RNA-binding protein n=1 Tax=Halobacterium salinarum TaxID=2242 RepID=UPI0025525022|nr:RNA-binding protein [Halobacterium salinarum]MDL0121170.1 RNA-binding protein [Halobacterium salinarum]MDL0132420.1 RNA-binding protein [Halobacterium salinarum]MDL0136052.1 RNA-binding protein [Halobacterium salinarum]MDL0138912.1 RNA-binding protein [Halobacterium salinarum]MDL0141035.1 RNA-binding protein [Halobacterium salinarum]
MDVSSRHHLRSDDIDEIGDALRTGLGVELDGDAYERVTFADEEFEIVLVDGEPLVWYPDGEPFVTVAGANRTDPSTGVVTVDAGAVSFVSDGADVMRPGITAASPEITAGDLVVIQEAAHGKTLAVGRALVGGTEMDGESGKVVSSLHHVGDELFEFSV